MELPSFSPWGPVQHCSILCGGVFEVDTARHGGIMVLRSVVDDVLSQPAQACGFWESGYLCFEEDADAQIVLRELLDQHLIEAPERFSPSEYDHLINQSIEHWHPDYWAYHESKGIADQAHTADNHTENGKDKSDMDMTICDMTAQERLYTYAQSQQIRVQTGSIGHLRGYFDKSGDFGHTWEPHSPDLITDDFRTEFDQVVNALRSDEKYGSLLKSPGRLTRYSFAHPDSRFDKKSNDFGVRADTKNHTYLLRLNPDRGEYNVYCYCYRADWLAQHMARAQRGIRFITPGYDEKFRIPDGDEIRVTVPDGETHDYECRYIDDYHFEMNGACHNLYHIAEFAERMERNGNTVIPLRSSLPEYCHSVLPSTGELILISRGTEGYMPADLKANGETGREAADRLNQQEGISKSQEAAMLAGSMFGWAVPAANPKNYDKQGVPQRSFHKHNYRAQ